MQPLISIIVPVYKAENYLDCCVKSILNQTFKDLELILVDDGSTDSSLTICNHWAEEDCRVHVIHKANGGASSARNAGIAIAKGEYLGFVDSDDWIELDMYEYLYALCQTHNADMVQAEMFAVNGTSARNQTDTLYKTEIWDRNGALDHFFRVHGEKDTHSVCGTIIRRKLFTQWQFIEGKMNEDVHACYCLAAFSEKTVYTNRPLYHYRKNLDGVTSCKFTYKKTDLLYMWDVVREMVKQITPEYIYACDMNRKRAYMTLLLKMYADGYDKKDEKLVGLKQELKQQVRKAYWDLMRWKMPISRKIVMTIAII